MTAAAISRAEIEDFLYHEAALLDSWKLDDWLGLLAEDASFYVPSNDAPRSSHRTALYTIADDANRIRARVKRLKDSQAHAEFPHSRTRRMIANVRITDRQGDMLAVAANFTVYRFRRGAPLREFVGHYHYRLRATAEGLRIVERRAVLDQTELGPLGAVSFIL